MDEESYFVRFRGRVTGPFAVDALQKLARRGMLSRLHEISSDRLTWAPAGDYEELFERPVRAATATVEPAANQQDEQQAPALEYASANQGDVNRYLYSQAGSVVGPVTEMVLRTLAENGTLGPDDLVWREGDNTSAPARQLTSLAVVFSRTTAIDHTLSRSTGGKFTYAGFWRRFGAIVTDTIICSILAVLLAFFIAFTFFSGAARLLDEPVVVVFINVVVFAGQWLYFSLMESSSRQATLGKMACGLIVTDGHGNRISFGRASGRYFAKIISGVIFCIGYMMAGWTSRRQALHDMIADTLVLNKEP